jgi:hypothetical protein
MAGFLGEKEENGSKRFCETRNILILRRRLTS